MSDVNDARERDCLIEEVVGAWRPKPQRALRFHPAWHDLPEEDRTTAFEATLKQRELEAHADPEGLSSTAHRVLARIRNAQIE